MSLNTYIRENKQDAILWLCHQWLDNIDQTPYNLIKATERIAELLSSMRNVVLQNSYAEYIGAEFKALKITPKKIKDAISTWSSATVMKDDIDFDLLDAIPAWMNRDEIEMKGFCTVKDGDNVGYFGFSGSSKVKITNFIMYPIFHVRGEAEDSRHIFEVENNKKKVLLDVPSKVFVSLETLQTHLVAKGGFLFFGSKPQLLLIADDLLDKFPLCEEIKQLGWQPEGFFSFVNKIFIPKRNQENKERGLKSIDSFGVVEVDKQYFLVPAASSIYTDVRGGDDSFKNLRPLSYKESPVSFEEWAAQMYKVYGDKGLTGIAYVFLTLNRDIAFKVNHSCPHLYAYGERSSGKSQFAIAVTSLFYNDRAAFNVNSGTDFAFFAYMRAYHNCPAWLNEVDDKVLKEEWFQSIKGIFDGEGRMRGKMGSRSLVEIQEVTSTLVLTGQWISTKDDNSLVSRCCVEAFAERSYSDAEKAEFDKLSQWQGQGLTSLICDLMEHRSEIEKSYYQIYNEIMGNWRKATTGDFNQRIFQNWCHLSAMYHIMGNHFDLPVLWPLFDKYCHDRAVQYSKFIRSTDTLTDFWNTVAFLLEQNEIIDGWDFIIKKVPEVNLRTSDDKNDKRVFEEPRKLLFIRLNSVHKLYQQTKNRSGSKDIMSMENLKHYFTSRPYYIGQVKQMRFKKYEYVSTEVTTGNHLAPGVTVNTERKPIEQVTSAFVFDYDLLGCELERSVIEADPIVAQTPTMF